MHIPDRSVDRPNDYLFVKLGCFALRCVHIPSCVFKLFFSLSSSLMSRSVRRSLSAYDDDDDEEEYPSIPLLG